MLSARSICLATLLWLGAATLPGVALAQMPPCAGEFIPLRKQVEEEGMKVKAAIEKKDRAEVCNSLKRFTVIEAKFVKYMEANQSWCGIPPDAVQQMKKNHANSLNLRHRACSAAAGPAQPAVPAGPGLSDALGTSRAPTPNTAKSGGGTFDTLTGSPFKQ